MNRFIEFLKESRTEMLEHVTWSKYADLQRTSVVVLVATLIFALVIKGMDMSFQAGVAALYDLF
ncbi:preprotein translocase subunit SecE [Hugenholtzia roseola]|uniref:preprotein translocase subunit SecE n=1 Tax=Hugenholtzia roseola TaxID=1002 RepID=UPI0003FF0B84|nr:preprotein translocase subunit SecE [Hugenholtzia roseola]